MARRPLKPKIHTENLVSFDPADLYGNFVEEFSRKLKTADELSMLPRAEREKQDRLQQESNKRYFVNSLVKRLGFGGEEAYDDGDQSPLVGDEAQILQNQWAYGMDADPSINKRLSDLPLALWCGNYEEAMKLIKDESGETLKKLLERRESMMNFSAIFFLCLGARILCGDKKLFKVHIANARRGGIPIKYEYTKLLKKLLELGARMDVKDVAGYTPLHHCLSCFKNPTIFEMATILLDAGADPNAVNRQGATPMVEAALASDCDAVSLLLKYGADPDIRPHNGPSVTHWATYNAKIANLINPARLRMIKKTRETMKAAAGGSFKSCETCGLVEKSPKRCTGCYLAWYCSAKCQKEAWNSHKGDCKETRSQYMKVQVKKDSLGIFKMNMNMYDRKGTEKDTQHESKSHFIVKIQVEIKNPLEGELGVYNRNRSFAGSIPKNTNREVFSSLANKIISEGVGGLKGFFYCILKDKRGHGEENLNMCEAEINVTRILPPETW